MFHLLLALIYISFISLGLPDALLGSAWPIMHTDFGIPISYAGIVSIIIAMGTTVSSLSCDRLSRRLGTEKLTAVSVAMTAFALYGFSISRSFIVLCIFAIPYGLGAGSVDASLNNYVAINYESRHMSWLHCMWGLGASIGPIIMGYTLAAKHTWNMGYRYISYLQIILAIILFMSLPIWRKNKKQESLQLQDNKEGEENKNKRIADIIRLKGAKEFIGVFFLYCALEQTAGLWTSTYLYINKGFSMDMAAKYGSLVFIGITLGRALSGFLTIKFTNKQVIKMGLNVIGLGIFLLFIPDITMLSILGFALIGIGSAPIYPCFMHSTPVCFGVDNSQSLIGLQMAGASLGVLTMPALFGIIANHINVSYLTLYMLLLLGLIYILYIRLSELLDKEIKKKA